MPELPEVESIRRSLEPKIVGRRVIGVTLHRRDVVVAPGDPYGGIARQRGAARGRTRPRRVVGADLLLGAVVMGVRRLGKQLAIVGERGDERAVVAVGVQLGMSGQLFHRGSGERVPTPRRSHVHAVWRFEDGRLIFRDPRRFGGLRVFTSAAALDEHWAELGPDALAVSAEQLAAGLGGSTRAVKAALLDQAVVAGVGNIYADEALFAAGVRPTRLCRELRDVEIAKIAACIGAVMRAAVEAGGSTLRDYVDANGDPGTYQLVHAVYGRAGEACPRCGGRLEAAAVAQRTTVWCGRCQR
jgi:formamidopyrimidine-DNA glycosylase